MSSPLTRPALLDLLVAFTETWAGTPSLPTTELFTDEVELIGSHRGNAQGREQVLKLLREDFSDLQVSIAATNRIPRAKDDEGVVGAYIHGEARSRDNTVDSEPVAFGGVIVLTIALESDRPRIQGIRFQLNWLEGNARLLPQWQVPPMERLWKPGDAPSAIVSELDAPWHRMPNSELATSDEQDIAEAWFRYAWALDQADFTLFEKSFSEEVEAELTPMGNMKGRRTLMGTLKAFRMPWPWMKHYGEPIQIEIDDSGNDAVMILGRIMPGGTKTPEGKPLYGAHYRIEAVREDSVWRLSRMEYIPGWISA